MAEAGFEIYGTFYPAAESFELGDPVLIRELTGLDFVDFSERYDELLVDIAQFGEEAEIDPILLLGLVGVAVWHTNPMWRRDKVVKFAVHVPMDAIKLIGDDEEAEDDDSPPAAAVEPTDSLSGGTQTDSSSSAEETANQNGSGDPTSPIGAASG